MADNLKDMIAKLRQSQTSKPNPVPITPKSEEEQEEEEFFNDMEESEQEQQVQQQQVQQPQVYQQPQQVHQQTKPIQKVPFKEKFEQAKKNFMNKGNPTSEEKEDTSINEELLILQNNGVYRREMLLQLTEINKSLAILTSLISKFSGE